MPVRLALAIALLSASLAASAEQPAGDKNIARDRQMVEKFDQGKKWAVVIGVNKYLDPAIPSLEFCVADACRLAQTLAQQCGYQEERILVIADDQPEDHLRPLRINLLMQIPAWLRNADEGDTVVVFFSGHGFVDSHGQGFLAPKDCLKEHLGLSGFRTDELSNMLVQCKATQKLLILDCCHAGAGKSGEKTGASGAELGAAFQRASGLITLASCREEEQSQEWRENRQGLFTYFLAKGLEGAGDYDANGVVDSDELYRYTVDKVPVTAQRVLNARQTPVRFIPKDVVGVFPLARVGGGAVPETRRQVTAAFEVREGDEKGPLLPGAKVELLYREASDGEALVLGSAICDTQGRAAVTTWLSARQQAQGDFLVLLSSAAVSQTWSLPGFPKSLDWNVYLPSPSPAKLVTNSLGMKLALIPAGDFEMGSSESPEELAKAFAQYDAKPQYFTDERPPHRVRISKPFYLGQHEVTVGQFRRFVDDAGYKTDAEKDGKGGYGWNATGGRFEQSPEYTWRNPGFSQTDDHPVVEVSWNDAVEFCKWLSRKEAHPYRLPTEAEWEYACRGGTSSRWWFGDDESSLVQCANVADATAKRECNLNYACAGSDGYAFTAPVGSFRANPWSLYDMHGNVYEWCADWYGESYYAASPSVDPSGLSSGEYRVLRGGSWNDSPWSTRSADRFWNSPVDRDFSFGFRVSRTP